MILIKRFPFGFLYLLIICGMLFARCEKDQVMDDPAGFHFPELNYVFPQIYDEMKKTCTARWDLNLLTDSTLVVLSYLEGYEIHCNGHSEGQAYDFVIITNLQGHWVSDHRNPITGERKTYFNPAKLEQLRLESIHYLWSRGFTLDTIPYHYFNRDLSYQGAFGLRNKKNESIEVSVFQTKKDAVRAMEMRRNNVAAIFRLGTHKIINDNWWYVIDWPGVVITNPLNTLVEVQIYTGSQTVKDSLYHIAREMARRIEVLAEES